MICNKFRKKNEVAPRMGAHKGRSMPEIQGGVTGETDILLVLVIRAGKSNKLYGKRWKKGYP